MRAQKYKTEAETFGWSFVFQDFVTEELKSKVTQRIEVLLIIQIIYHLNHLSFKCEDLLLI